MRETEIDFEQTGTGNLRSTEETDYLQRQRFFKVEREFS
jgi:hypothetical protein